MLPSCQMYLWLLKQVFMMVRSFIPQNSRSLTPASLQLPTPRFPHTSLHTSLSPSLFPTHALKSPSTTRMSPAGTRSSASWRSSKSLAFTPRGAFAVTDIYRHIQTLLTCVLLVSLKPPGHLRPLPTTFSRAVTTHELTASQVSPAFFQAIVACLSKKKKNSRIPTPSFLTWGSVSSGSARPE